MRTRVPGPGRGHGGAQGGLEGPGVRSGRSWIVEHRGSGGRSGDGLIEASDTTHTRTRGREPLKDSAALHAHRRLRHSRATLMPASYANIVDSVLTMSSANTASTQRAVGREAESMVCRRGTETAETAGHGGRRAARSRGSARLMNQKEARTTTPVVLVVVADPVDLIARKMRHQSGGVCALEATPTATGIGGSGRK